MAIFSLEMSKESLLTRMLCAAARVDSQKFPRRLPEPGGAPQAATTRCTSWWRRRSTSTTRPALHLMDMHAKLRRLQAERNSWGW